MNTILLPLGFAAASFLSIATPGPDVLLAIRNGARHGVRGACPGLLGVAVSDCILVATIAVGIGAVVLDRTDIFLALKTFGILYLAFISLALLRSADQNGVAILSAPDRSAADSSSVFMRSFVVAVTNPKAWLFFSAVLPQFIAAEAELSGQVLVLTGLVVAIDTVVLFGYVLLGSHLSRWLEERRGHWIDRISGVLLLTIAAGLALEHLWSS